MLNNEYFLEAENISKSYLGIHALENVELRVRPGEVHALIGENGAGKSTLMKIIMGIVKQDKGYVKVDGKRVDFSNPADALEMGISMIHQELTPLPNMTVVENLFLGQELGKKINCFVDKRSMIKSTNKTLEEYRLNFSASSKVESLSVAQIQMLEIIKAVRGNSKMIIMDEPTSSLSSEESENLFKIINDLTKKDVAIIYISHRLEEVLELADRVTVLRDGTYINTCSIDNVDRDKMIEMMVGRTLDSVFPKKEVVIGETFFEVKGLSRKGVFKDISFSLKKGEILGISGLMGAGRSEIARAIFGLDSIDSGVMVLDGEKLNVKSPRDAVQKGISMVSEDRKHLGLILCRSIKENITLPNLKEFVGGLRFNKKLEKSEAVKMAEKLGVKYAIINDNVDSLSGGNQQKVVIAKWLMSKPSVLILDEPTRGIDVGAKAEIHELMSELAETGIGIIMISSEMPEILGMSDRVLVISGGEITGEFFREDIVAGKLTQNALLNKALINS